MSTTFKKFASITVSAVTMVWALGGVFPFSAQAATVEELQAQIAQLLAQINLLQSQLTQQGGGASAGTSYNFTRDLTLGSVGEDVRALQQFLNA